MSGYATMSEWPVTRLRYQARLNPAPSASIRAKTAMEVTFLAMESIGEDGLVCNDQERAVGELLTGYSYFENSDLIVAKVTPCFENGKAALLSGLPAGVGFGTTEVTVLRPGPSLDGRFLYYLSREDHFMQGGIAAMTGAGGLKRVPDSYIRDYTFGLPALDWQRQIADYLDAQTAKIDALIGKQERLIETLAERRQAVISQQIEGQANPERFDQPGSRIKTAYAVVDTRAGSADLPLLSVSIHRGVQRRDEVTDDRPRSDDLSVYKSCASGDVVVNRMRAFQGAVGIASEPGLVSPDYLVLRAVERVDPHWLTLVMRSRWFVGLMTARLRGIGNTETGTVRTPRINATDLGEIRIALPTLEAQREIVAHLDRETSQIDTLSAKAREMIDVLKERRQALISAAVTGKIDVRGLA